MRKLLLPSALILLGLAGYSFAQTINRSLQQSQDVTGAFSVDTFSGVYFPGHIISSTSINARPAPSIAGTATATLSGTDSSGLITMGTNATTATVTFGTAYLQIPNCVVSYQTGSPVSIVLATTSLQITQISSSGNKLNYFCASGG